MGTPHVVITHGLRKNALALCACPPAGCQLMAANSTVAVVYSGHLGVVVPEAGALARRFLVEPLRATVFVAGQHGKRCHTWSQLGRSLSTRLPRATV